ncbi:ATP-binding protein [Neolewinella antarctica]|uniref:ATPase n=1 Tax=Neolewinella antarctica TaxID=442734 RepID=A0ABX0X6Z6_9BACT|nr:ATP-binding protein [Neolewinella antarctica]NJC24830.1 putative ATPase [Neolewinella antarctica]
MVFSTENPWREEGSEGPGPATRQTIEATGGPKQKRWLDEWRFSQMNPEQQDRQREFLDMIQSDPMQPTEIERVDSSLARMFRTMHKRSVDAIVPPDVMYRAAKILLYRAFENQVVFETGKKPNLQDRPELLTAMHQIAHWLVGHDGDQCECARPVKLIPIRKSPYLYGPLGTGKSTLAMAAHYASTQLQAQYNTGMSLQYRSMDELIMSVYSRQSLSEVEEASKGNVILDEMRTEHIGYKHFGNDVKILSDILLVRHHAWKQRGAQTIITTNIPPKSLTEALSDERLQDRMMQQYHDILITGESFRAKQADPLLEATSASA